MDKKKLSMIRMQRIVKVARNYKEAQEWDILQHIHMTPAERQQAALELKRRVYGKSWADIRKVHSG